MRLTCQECQDLFSSYLDQELEGQDNSKMMEHLGQCVACAAEWQEFKDTVQFIHEMPMLAAPPDLLPDINAELAPQSLLDRISRWLGFSHPKTALTTILATFVVGIVSASLIYLPSRPLGQSGASGVNPAGNYSTTASRSENQTVTSMPVKTAKVENFYPGIPSLSEYAPADDSLPQSLQPSIVQAKSRFSSVPLVSLVSTGINRNVSGSSLHTPFSSKPQAVHQARPDVIITVNQNSRQADFFHQLIHSGKWQCENIRDNQLLLAMPPSHLAMLRNVLEQQKLSYVQMYRPGAPKKLLKVAVKLQP